MIIETKDLGFVEVEESNVIHFPHGIYGFEGAKRYALLSDHDSSNPFLWLQHADSREPCFVVTDAHRLFSDYSPEVTPQMEETIGLKTPDALRILTIVTVPKDYRGLSLNLKCPILINAADNVAAQVILEDDTYPMRYYLFGRTGE
ncbi:MAG: flagellar assembly protein FliW [Clostridia bacterium]|nr:flagellar assembly protein FliW [Clostridia bacterium]